MVEGTKEPTPFSKVARAAWRGLRLRCPNCGQGPLFAGPVGLRDACTHCSQVYEFHPGNWSGAVMISQMLMGLLAIPVWLILTLATDLEFTYTVVWTVVIVIAVWFVTYRNIKGLWYGWLLAMNVQHLGQDRQG